MHWIWANEIVSEDQAMIHGTPSVIAADDSLSFDDGQYLERKIPVIEIEQGSDSQGILTDNLIVGGVRGLMFNNRLRQLLASLAIDNLQYFPCVIRNSVTGEVSEDYQIANLIARVACVDLGQSQLEMFTHNPAQIQFIDSLTLDEAKIGDFDFFRMHEQDQVIVASDRLKQACEANRITGVRFYSPREFSM